MASNGVRKVAKQFLQHGERRGIVVTVTSVSRLAYEKWTARQVALMAGLASCHLTRPHEEFRTGSVYPNVRNVTKRDTCLRSNVDASITKRIAPTEDRQTDRGSSRCTPPSVYATIAIAPVSRFRAAVQVTAALQPIITICREGRGASRMVAAHAHGRMSQQFTEMHQNKGGKGFHSTEFHHADHVQHHSPVVLRHRRTFTDIPKKTHRGQIQRYPISESYSLAN